jgi:hypothetical protein
LSSFLGHYFWAADCLQWVGANNRLVTANRCHQLFVVPTSSSSTRSMSSLLARKFVARRRVIAGSSFVRPWRAAKPRRPRVPWIIRLRRLASRRAAPSSIRRTSGLTSSANVMASRSPDPNVAGKSRSEFKGARTRSQSGLSAIQRRTDPGVWRSVSSRSTAGGINTLPYSAGKSWTSSISTRYRSGLASATTITYFFGSPLAASSALRFSHSCSPSSHSRLKSSIE